MSVDTLKFNNIVFCFSFPNLGIQHVTKKNVKTVLKDRYLKRYQLEKSVITSNPVAGVQAMNIDVSNKDSDEAIISNITSKCQDNVTLDNFFFNFEI